MAMTKKSWLVGVVMMVGTGMAFAATPLPAGASFDAGFSPAGSALDVVIKGISAAKKQVLVAAYSLSSKPVATALVNAQRRGVQVFVVADKGSNQKGYGVAQYLANQGIPVRLNGNYQSMHHKFLVIDNDSLQLGSFNYSAAAEKNAENALLLWNVPGLASSYVREWKRVWDEAQPLPKAY